MKYSPQKPQTETNVFETEPEAKAVSSQKEKGKGKGRAKKRTRFKLGYSLICVFLVAIVARCQRGLYLFQHGLYHRFDHLCGNRQRL